MSKPPNRLLPPADRPVQYLPGIGPRRAEALERIGVRTVGDLLLHLPRGYEDRRTVWPIAEAPAGFAAVEGVVVKTEFRPIRRNLSVFRALLRDASGDVQCVWYNRAYVKEKVVPGVRLAVWGDLERDLGGPAVLNVREWAEADRRADVVGRIFAVYPLTAGVTQTSLRRAVAAALAGGPPARSDEDAAEIGLPPLAEALRALHLPRAPIEVEPARRRVAWEECVALARSLARRRGARAPRPRPAVSVEAAERLRAGLPFALTPGQAAAWEEIRADLAAERPMRRLLQADVGAGKTAVAALAVAAVAGAGRQAAFMAPTEVLAEQHHANWAARFEALGLRTVLLSAAHRDARNEILEAAVAIGTHALLEEDVRFRRLGLAVVDEEQRFGVTQREGLVAKGAATDLLCLTATPIPRTLAMTLYADLDSTTIPDLPPGRKGIETVHLRRSERRCLLPLVKKTLAAKGQILFVYPVIDESESRDVRSAEAQARRIAAAFPGVETACLTGRLPGEDREGIARAFREGRVRILVATTVVEVGIDVPGAALVVIEDAERFGLAQLHQLRGRIGRGAHRSYCVLFDESGPENLEARQRLEAMARTTDGFALADEDLRLRGEGTLFDVRQSGMPDLRLARLAEDLELVKRARRRAFALISEDPTLERHPALLDELRARFERGLDWLFHS